ncbi:MAG: suppressor of fused domain protein [Clostridia bacterium]|nr:suppressor of fused domain protein [Clostridia bacterium]
MKETEELNSSGWDAITNECNTVYPNQKNPKHYGTLIKWKLGGNDPLDGISIYDGGNYWHFVTYGLSELYEKETDDLQYSGYGMEFTFKLKKDNYEDEEQEIKCICGILQTIARITFNKGEIFNPFEYLYTGQAVGIDAKQKSNITGFITVPDDKLQTLNTPNGKVEFVQFIGVTNKEIEAIKNKELKVTELYEKLGSGITDYNRKSVI